MDRGLVPTIPRVVHVAGSVTEDVFRFLGPTTRALAGAGREQTVVMIDEPGNAARPAALHETVEVMVAPRVGNPLGQGAALLHRCREAMLNRPLHAVHLHGLVPGLIGAWAARSADPRALVYYSPHAPASSLTALALLAARPVLQPRRSAVIVSTPEEVRAFEDWRSSELIEIPVAESFFETDRAETARPLIVGGGSGQGVDAAASFAQLAVLLGGEDLHIGFRWLGGADRIAHVPLQVAGVEVCDVSDDIERAAHLSPGWIHLAAGAATGSPLGLVEAMAAGMPCVAVDCPLHRDLIRDGETGFLYSSDRDVLERLARLIDDPALRERLGSAARREARRRFGEAAFASKLLAAYALSTDSHTARRFG